MHTSDVRSPNLWVKRILIVAGVWNICGALQLLSLSSVLLPLIFPTSAGPPNPMAQFHITSLWLFVGLVGVTLLLGTRAPHEYRGVMLLSALGKTAFGGLLFAYWLQGDASTLLMLAGLGDVVLAGGLFWAYRQTRSQPNRITGLS